jgi:signal transduction histidine kinase
LIGSLLTMQGFDDTNRAAAAATQAKTEFLANMSHEIRTPITAILGYTDLLLEPNLPDVERQDYLRTIRRNGRMLSELIDNILDITKIEAGKLEVDRTRCSPWQTLADVAALMQVRADAKNLALVIECRGPLPDTMCTDPTRLRQILVNLVGNALKFTAAGEVRVVASLRNEKGREPALQFEVIDSGILSCRPTPRPVGVSAAPAWG